MACYFSIVKINMKWDFSHIDEMALMMCYFSHIVLLVYC